MHTQTSPACPAVDVQALTARVPLYEQRMRLGGYNCEVNVFIAVSDGDAGKIARKLFPDLDSNQHADLCVQHQLADQELTKAYAAEVDAVFMRNLGRPPELTDYQVSAIWLDEFPETDKDLLRSLAHGSSKHGRIARAHRAAARQLNRGRSRR